LEKHENLLLFPDVALPDVLPARQERLTFKANRERGRHGWLRLTPAYSVQLVEELVADCTKEDVILDPFCGTGTTALTCGQQGIRCDTVDINPFLVWLAEAKCALYAGEEREAANGVLAEALAGLDVRNAGCWVPAIKDIEKWWSAEVLGCLAQVFEHMGRAALSERAGDLLRVIFCRACIELARVSFGHQSLSFRKDVAPALLFDRPVEEKVRAVFRGVAAEVLRSAGEPVREGCASAVLGDARRLEDILPGASYTKVITSPPYPNRMSYIRELRPYMYWLGYLSSGRQAGELDWQAIGGTWGVATSNLTTWEANPAYALPGEDYAVLIARVAGRSKVLGVIHSSLD
jgi:hypothetical protein